MDKVDIKIELQDDADYTYSNEGKILSYVTREHPDGLVHKSVTAICVVNGKELKKAFSIDNFLRSGITGSHEIFTCSCGFAGCAGINDGIKVKQRRHTVEWRMPEHSDYTFLDKKFYSFDKTEYEDARVSLIWRLRIHALDPTVHDQFCYEVDENNALRNIMKYYELAYKGKHWYD